MSRISLDAAGQKTVNFQDAIMAHGYELWLQMSPTPHMAANYQCQYKISETLLNSCVWHARGLCIFVSLPKNFAVVNYTTYYLQTSSVHHQCTGDSLFNYPYTLLIIKSLHYAMMSRYHTTNENKSYYHSSHKSKSVSWNRSSSISYTKILGTIWRDQELFIPTGISASNITWYQILNVSPCQPLTPTKIVGPNPRMMFCNTGKQKWGAILSKMQMKPNTKKIQQQRHFNKYIGPSQTATTYKQTASPPQWAARGRTTSYWVPKPSFVHAWPVGSLSISQTNGIWRKQIRIHFKRIRGFKFSSISQKFPQNGGYFRHIHHHTSL